MAPYPSDPGQVLGESFPDAPITDWPWSVRLAASLSRQQGAPFGRLLDRIADHIEQQDCQITEQAKLIEKWKRYGSDCVCRCPMEGMK